MASVLPPPGLLPPPSQVPENGRCVYRVVTKTSDLRGAGTDADVAMTLYGDKGDTGERKLDNSKNNFERNEVGLLFSFQGFRVGQQGGPALNSLGV